MEGMEKNETGGKPKIFGQSIKRARSDTKSEKLGESSVLLRAAKKHGVSLDDKPLAASVSDPGPEGGGKAAGEAEAKGTRSRGGSKGKK